MRKKPLFNRGFALFGNLSFDIGHEAALALFVADAVHLVNVAIYIAVEIGDEALPHLVGFSAVFT